MKYKVGSFILVVFFFQFSQAQIGRLQLSPYQETEIKIANTDIKITYSRPSKKGRAIFGHLVPFNEWWRTGANKNTTIEFNEAVIIDSKRVEKGKYAIFSKPNPDQWEVIFYKKTDNWNVPKNIDTNQIAAKIRVPTSKLDTALEVLSITISDFTNYHVDITIAWDTTQIRLPIALTTQEIMETKIANTLNGPVPHDYYAAAVYEMESGKNFERGLQWINTAIHMRKESSWWDLRVKAVLLLELSKKEEALKFAQTALEMATKEKHAYGITEMGRIVKRCKE